MRPIRLDMHGFASFREPTRVDFGDADFFALIGPTGSGKSTVIDAMTFALYGSVPRWGRKGMVSLALAPTVARSTVKLVFEVDGQRYVAARELRRAASKDGQGKVGQKAATLERILDPDGLALPGESTVPLAKDVDGVTEAVERLLGLSYEHFIGCVVLPQGQFADFLHAKPGDRQEILLRLLGAEHYKQMMMKANQRAASAQQRAEAIAETLSGYADATPEALDAAVATETALASLEEKVTAALPRIRDAQTALSAAEEQLRTLRAEHEALIELRVPPGVEELDAALAAARGALAEARAAERKAEEIDTAARDALARGPERAPLELARERRAERERHAASLPDLTTRASEREASVASAASAVDEATRSVETLRAAREAAQRRAAEADERVAALREEHAALSSVTVPDGVASLDAGQGQAQAALADAEAAVAEAERAEAAARDAVVGAPPQAPAMQAASDLGSLREVLAGLQGDRAAATQARREQEAADKAVASAEKTLRRAQQALEEGRHAHVIAGLRPYLVAGEACPLCEQTVAVLPEAAPSPEGAALRALVGEAERQLNRARSAADGAGKNAVRAENTLEQAVKRGTSHLAALAKTLDGPLADAALPAARRLAPAAMDAVDHDTLDRARAEIGALLGQRERLERDARQAARDADAARAAHRKAQAAVRQADSDLTAARQALSAARDPLVRFGAPPAEAATLAEAWTELRQWAAARAAERATALTAAQTAAQAARQEHAARAREFGDAERVLAAAHAQWQTASEQHTKARSDLDHVTSRVTELDALLKDAPGDDEISASLALLDRLRSEADAAARALRQARDAREKGESALSVREKEVDLARRELSAARDRVVSFGAPAIDGGTGLLDGWTALVAWAGERAAARERDIEAATGAATAQRKETGSLTAALTGDLAAAGITADPETVADRAQTLVATAREKAHAAVRRVRERQGEAASLLARRKEAQEEQHVAKMLGDLLRANAFQRWLVGAALDDLVACASATLNDLSSGQFDLSYDDGEFYVIDHADADARRSVRTLSGGETFQASLALALALSSQISALAAAGAARLDSIFLDEGFGTLDAETLDVVATTLETLAQGDRMVGVVTHVGALAERVPVRLRVSRNARTSTVMREELA